MVFDKFNEECAIIGLVGVPEAANYAYLGLYSMQHRGQEGAGIVSTDRNHFYSHKNVGLVADVFKSNAIEQLHGPLAIGHTRYATFGSKDHLENLQPLIANVARRPYAISHNGNLVNAEELRESLEERGAIFASTSDTEVILHLIAHAKNTSSLLERTVEALKHVKGAFSLIVLSLGGIIAVRDPSGVRPLSLGTKDGGFVVASETCAFDLIGAEFVRDIEPGEVLDIAADGSMRSAKLTAANRKAFCVFEYVYFSRPDSNIEGQNVYDVRKRLGKELAKECPVDADYVVPVPDSGVPAAIGYSEESRIPLELGLIRNHYVGRTFIEPKQSIRDFGVKVKLNANTKLLSGKRVILVDDSLVRGTTSKKIVKMVREAGATEVHFRISSPPIISPCHYGIDTPSKSELIASSQEVEDIRKYIGADTLGYLSNAGMFSAVGKEKNCFCDACFSGEYVVGEPRPKNGKSCGASSVIQSSLQKQ